MIYYYLLLIILLYKIICPKRAILYSSIVKTIAIMLMVKSGTSISEQILLTRSLKKDLQHLSEGIRHKKIGRTVDIINEQHKNYTNPHYHMNRALQVIQVSH